MCACVCVGVLHTTHTHLVLLLHLLHLAQLLGGEHALDALHVPHQQPLRLQELVVGPLPGVLQLVVLLALQLQLVTHWPSHMGTTHR